MELKMDLGMDLASTQAHLRAHARSLRNGSFPHVVTSAASLTHPACENLGDVVELRVHVRAGRIVDLGFAARACAVCTASAAILCRTLRRRSVRAALELADLFEDQIQLTEADPWPVSLKDLAGFRPLRVHPARRACAVLPWLVLKTVLR